MGLEVKSSLFESRLIVESFGFSVRLSVLLGFEGFGRRNPSFIWSWRFLNAFRGVFMNSDCCFVLRGIRSLSCSCVIVRGILESLLALSADSLLLSSRALVTVLCSDL